MQTDLRVLDAGTKTSRNFLVLAVFFNALSAAIALPILPKLLATFVYDEPAKTARLFGLFSLAGAATQFFGGPILCSLSDQFGRRPIILLSCLSQAVDFIILALAPSIGVLFLGRILSGVSSANTATIYAYMSDITDGNNRSHHFGTLIAASSCGFVIGAGLGGLLGASSLRLPFWFAAGVTALNFIYGFFVVEGTRPRPAGIDLITSSLNPFKNLSMIFRKTMLAPAVFYSIGILAQQEIPSILILYVQNKFHWEFASIGLVLAGTGIAFAIVAIFFLKPIVARIGDFSAMIFGTLCGAIAFLVFGFATNSWEFLAGLPIIAFWSLSSPTLQAIVSSKVTAGEQGALQGALNSLAGLGGVMGPFLFTQIYSLCLSRQLFPGTPFVISSALLFFSALVANKIATTTRQV